MRWSLLERSILARYAVAIAIAVIAIAGHWLIFPYTQGRIPFLLFLPSTIFATWLAGRGPGLVVVVAGMVNATLQLAPVGALSLSYSGDRLAVLAYVLTGLFLVFVGGRLRSTARREFDDLHELHELSAAVATSVDLQEQLDLILQTLARIHGADRGLVSLYDPQSGTLRIATSLRLTDAAGGEALCGIACRERRRVIVADVNRGARFESLRDLAARADFRAAHTVPLVSRGGDVLGAISVHFRAPRRPTPREISLADICARKAAGALERTAAEDLARYREQRFRTVLESSAVPFMILEPRRADSGEITDFRWNYVNAAAARALRHPPERLLGQRVAEVLPGTWEEPGLLRMYAAAIEKQEPFERELRSDANGIVGWFQLVASPLEDMLAVWFADITERKEQERALQEAGRRKDEFLATLAHELRNPLAPIRQAAAIADNERASDAQRRWGYSVIERQVQHMSLLLDDLLDVSRITRGTLSLRKQAVELRDVVSAAIETARPLMDSRHHQLQVDVPDALALNADPLRLSQILANLLTNAAKYTPSGGTIRLAAERQHRTLIVRVADTGIGLRDEDMPRLFHMFSQVRSSHEHSQGGLGIGLALTKGLVEMHSGTIEASSGGAGKGSTFIVRLPMGDVALVLAQSRSEECESRLVMSRRVLIADDNRDAADSLAMMLRLEGHDVVVAHDGNAALSLFDGRMPDVALLDIGMPHMNGYEVARQIRARPGGEHVLLVAVTGWGQEKDRRQSREAGFDHHLTKPVEPDVISRLMQPKRRGTAAAG